MSVERDWNEVAPATTGVTDRQEGSEVDRYGRTS